MDGRFRACYVVFRMPDKSAMESWELAAMAEYSMIRKIKAFRIEFMLLDRQRPRMPGTKGRACRKTFADS